MMSLNLKKNIPQPSAIKDVMIASEPSVNNTIESFFGNVDSSKSFLEFKAMLECEKIKDIGTCALKIMEFL